MAKLLATITFGLQVESNLKDTMSNRNYILALILTVLWIITYLFFDFGLYPYVLLVVAYIIVLRQIVHDDNLA